MNILVIGSGAVGSFYGSLLARGGHRVSVLARSDYTVIKKRGIHLRSDTDLGSWHFIPAEVIRDKEALSDIPDLVLLCTKVVDHLDRVALLRPFVGPSTAIGLISNGIEIEAPIHEAYKNHELISGLAFICVTRTQPGEIWHQAYGHLVLGSYPHGVSEKTLELAKAIESSGIQAATTNDIVTARWKKCLWNAAFNPVSVLSGGRTTQEILATARPLIENIMNEVRMIAAAHGHLLDEKVAEEQIESTLKMPPYKTSMLLDFEAGRPLETEAILGNAIRAAEQRGIPHPNLATLYQLLRLKTASKKPDGTAIPVAKEDREIANH